MQNTNKSLSFYASYEEKSILGLKIVSITPHFLRNKTLLSRDIDFRKNLAKQVADERFVFPISLSKTSITQKTYDHTLVRINISALKWFISEKMRCDVSHFQS